MRFVNTFILIFITSSLLAFEPYNFMITAKKGDGIFSVLRKYKLLDHSCSKARFLELNNIQITDHLQIGKEYKLPIKIYQYNGTSIRTTIGIESWEQAVRIKKYNELMEWAKKKRYKDGVKLERLIFEKFDDKYVVTVEAPGWSRNDSNRVVEYILTKEFKNISKNHNIDIKSVNYSGGHGDRDDVETINYQVK